MMLYALTDFLVVIGVAIAVKALIALSPFTAPRQAIIGLGLFALAALIGTVRFATGAIESLAPAHSYFSNWAGVTGVLLVSLASLQSTIGREPTHARAQTAMIGSLLIIGLVAAWNGNVIVLRLVPALAIAASVTFCFVLGVRGSWRPALSWLASWFLLLFATIAIGGSREATTLGIANWHIYHALLAIWAVLVGVAVRTSVKAKES